MACLDFNFWSEFCNDLTNDVFRTLSVLSCSCHVSERTDISKLFM